MEPSSSTTVAPACPEPCKSCPWRTANQGSKPDPHKFYTPSNLARLWRGLRNGARMSCHPTDPRMAEFAGYEALADRDTTHECAGSLIVVQREFMRFQALIEIDPTVKGVPLYRRTRPKGLTRSGLIAIFERFAFRGTGLAGTAMSTPDLNHADVGYDVLGAWIARQPKKEESTP